MTATIRPACLRDASWIMANLRPLDHLEAFCQLEPGYKTADLAAFSVQYGESFVAYDGDEPAMVFGTVPANVCAGVVWALGTKRARRVVPAVTRFFLEEHGPALLARGFTSLEARSIENHTDAHRWMEATGAVRHGEPFVYGRNGERFVLFRWTSDRFSGIRIPQHGKSPEDQPCSTRSPALSTAR